MSKGGQREPLFSVGPRPNRFPKIALRFSDLVAEFEGYTARHPPNPAASGNIQRDVESRGKSLEK